MLDIKEMLPKYQVILDEIGKAYEEGKINDPIYNQIAENLIKIIELLENSS